MKYNLMAKRKQVVKTVKRVKRRSSKKTGSSLGVTGVRQRYARLLHNPDNGDHLFDVYDGERGDTQKFVSSLTVNTGASDRAGLIFFYGATGNYFGGSLANSNSAVTLTLRNVGAPGQVFLDANAAKTRCKALKLELIPAAASFTNITGEVAAGVTTSQNFISGTTTVDQMFDLAKAYGPIRRETICSRWIPSGLDHTYAQYNSAPNEDHNAVYIAYRGWPIGVPLSVRITYVVEYTVRNGVGIPPTGAVSSPLGHHEVLAAMQQSDPHWHHSILDEVKGAGLGIARDIGNWGRNMAREGMMKIAGNFFKKEAPLLLTMA